MNFTINIIIFSFCLVLLLNDCKAEKQKPHKKYCHINEIAKCWEPLRYFSAKVNGTGIVTNENEFNWSCGQQQIAMKKCTVNWFKRCGTSMHWQIFENLVSKSLLETMDDLCDYNKPLRKTFLEQSPCLHEKVKQLPEYRSVCVKDIQSGFEWIQNTTKYNLTQQFQSTCCVYNRWEKCITDFLIEKCGPQQDQSIRILIGTATTFILSEFCRFKKFHPESELCLKYYQPKDLIPKGLKSNSYVSWVFSYYCPNIGYGIQLEKDVLY